MNIIKSFFLLLIASVFFTSCDKDLLEQVPNDRISNDIFWQTEADAVLGANAAYNNLDALEIFFWDGISDIGHVNATTSFVSEFVRGQHTSLTPRVRSEWIGRYDGIFATNTFFANVEKVQNANPQVIDILKGEVRTLRAYHYIQLAAVFGDVPLITEPIDIETGKSIPRTDVNQIWDFIAQELDNAAAVLPVKQTQKGRITKGAALALKARAMLFAGRLQQAADAAKAVIDLNEYSLYPAYKDLFTYGAESNSEVILEKGFLAGTYAHNVFALMAPYSQKSSSNFYIPTKEYVDAFEMNNGKAITDPTSGFDPFNPYMDRDPRLRYSIFLHGDPLPNGFGIFRPTPGSGAPDEAGSNFLATSTGFTLKKYINSTYFVTPANSGLNIILLRYPEVLLTYAEAKIELNQIDASVYDAINQIRQRPDVMMPVIEPGKTQDELRSIVRNERVVELGFEGLRYFDLKRWMIAENVLNGEIYGMTYVKNGNLETIEVPAIQNAFNPGRDYLWPIPFDEILLNPALTQNPGY